MKKIYIFLSVTFYVCTLHGIAEPAETKPVITVTQTVKEINVDGKLDEQAWRDAVPYESHFFQHEPKDREPSPEKTKVMVLQNDKMLYFGVQCYDSHPDEIFATAMRRDKNIWRDDVIEILLDTFQDNRNCYAFVTNPLGVLGDAIISDRGNHINLPWDGIVYMDGAMNEHGWSCEFGIPFKTLKYKEGENVDWGINIAREIKRRNETSYLVPIPRGLGHMAKFHGERYGTLTNIQPPKQGLNLQVTPYLLGGQTHIYQPTQSTQTEQRIGLDVSYNISPQLALDLTYKTDFAQAESEEEVVNVTRFNIRRTEKREFFLQSAGLFQFGVGQREQRNFSLFDSRTIGIKNGQRVPLWGGAKLTGRTGPYSIAALNLQSERTSLQNAIEPSTNYSAVRLKRDVSQDSHIGLMTLNKQYSQSRYSRTFGVDGLWNVTDEVRIDGSVAKSFSHDITGKNTAGDLGFRLNKEWIDFNLRYTSIDSLFQPEMGFVRRPNIRLFDTELAFTKWINGELFQTLSVGTDWVNATNHHNTLQSRSNSFYGSAVFSSGDAVSLGISRNYEFLANDDAIRHLIIDAGDYTTWTRHVSFRSYQARKIRASVSYKQGSLFDGSTESVNVTNTMHVSKNLLVDAEYVYNHLDLSSGELDAHVLATRWTYCFTTDLFAKTYIQWNSADERLSANFLIDWTYRPCSHIYFVYNENRNTLYNRTNDRLFLIKFTYVWQS